MEVIQIIVLAVFFLICAVLIFLILIQSGKGGGLGVLGGGGSQSAFGSSTMDVVTKATWWGALGFFALAIGAAIAFSDSAEIPITPGDQEVTPSSAPAAGPDAEGGQDAPPADSEATPPATEDETTPE